MSFGKSYLKIENEFQIPEKEIYIQLEVRGECNPNTFPINSVKKLGFAGYQWPLYYDSRDKSPYISLNQWLRFRYTEE